MNWSLSKHNLQLIMAFWKSCSPSTWVSVHIVSRLELTWQFMTAPEHSWDRIKAAAHRVHTGWIILSTRVRVKVIFLFLRNRKIGILVKYSRFKSSWVTFILKCFKNDLNALLLQSLIAVRCKSELHEELWCIAPKSIASLFLSNKPTQKKVVVNPKYLTAGQGIFWAAESLFTSISPDSCQEHFGMISDRFAKDTRFRALHHTLLI